MAKGPAKPTGSSRIRFIMVEADIADGENLGHITQAIQNALRPATPMSRLAAPRPNGAARQQADTVVQETVDDEVADQAEEEVILDEAQPPRERKPRKVRTPEVLDVDLTGEPAFAPFATEANPTSHQMRFLTVAPWFKLHRGLDAVTAEHVYTCYRHMKWPADVPDFWQPLRDLKARKFMGLKERGHYAINHLGLQEVEELAKKNLGT